LEVANDNETGLLRDEGKWVLMAIVDLARTVRHAKVKENVKG
jgi:hypothetical protein